MDMKRLACLFILSLFILSCEKEGPTVEDPFGLNRKKWMAQEIDSYAFDLTIVCFCPQEFLGPNRIKVISGEIAEVNGAPYGESNFAYPTIDELFRFIESQMALSPQIAEVRYNYRYGYPSHIYFDMSDRIADEEMDYTITNFTRLP